MPIENTVILNEIAAKLGLRASGNNSINAAVMVQKPTKQRHPPEIPLPLTLRAGVSADSEALRSLQCEQLCWDLPAFSLQSTQLEVIERGERIVAAARSGFARIEPIWVAEPLPKHTPELLDGPRNAVVGAGLWIDRSLDLDTAVRIHRLFRTLRAQQEAARWCLICVPFDVPQPHTRESAAQHAPFGTFGDGPLPRVVADGYWPVALHPTESALYCVWRNEVM